MIGSCELKARVEESLGTVLDPGDAAKALDVLKGGDTGE